MFPLKQRKIGGYEFREKTFYSARHLGVDYSANYVPLYAPFSGTVTTSVGVQGGNTITFRPDGQDVVMRFMHLSEMSGGHFNEGDQIGITGNTGSATTAAHLHLDISKGSVQINNIDNFIDPETFNWGKEEMGFSDEHMRGVVEGAIKASRKNLFSTIKDWEADVNLLMEKIKSGSTSVLGEQIDGFFKASDKKWITKAECESIVMSLQERIDTELKNIEIMQDDYQKEISKWLQEKNDLIKQINDLKSNEGENGTADTTEPSGLLYRIFRFISDSFSRNKK